MTPASASQATGWIFAEQYLWHDVGAGAAFLPAGDILEPGQHVESPTTKRRLRNLLEVSGLLKHLRAIEPRAATHEELLRFHTHDYIERVRSLSACRGGEAGDHAPFGKGSFEIALLAVGGCLTAVEAVVGGEVKNAYALVRPPGHHAERDRGRGFCIFANAALSALHARAALGIERVAVIDWDVHHGNGTQQAFWTEPNVLTISIHQDSLYPRDSGNLDERGEGAGAGFNINVPLPPGSGEGAYLATMRRVVLPALANFRPQLCIVACGFDSSALDPLGRMTLRSESYRTMAQMAVDGAERLSAGRLVFCHEGGYSEAYVPFCGLAALEALSGRRTGVEDPFFRSQHRPPYDSVLPHQDAVIAEAEQHALAVPPPMRAASSPA